MVIGAGQAGLAAAQQLATRGLTPGSDFLVLDANDGPGGTWRHRWDSLTLGKAHGNADLPGMRAPLGDDSTPASRQVADYYSTYETRFDLAVLRPVQVLRVSGAGPFRLLLSTGETLTARVIINATGTWDSPFIPFIPGTTDFRGRQLHTRDYVRASDFAGQKTLVVGGGLSAVQFLLELDSVTETVWATRRPPDFSTRSQSENWGRDVEQRVRARTFRGEAPGSVVANTGIPARSDYAAGVARGLLVSRGMFTQVTSNGVVFGEAASPPSYGWDPLPAGTFMAVDTIFWNTGFRPSLRHSRRYTCETLRAGSACLTRSRPLVTPVFSSPATVPLPRQSGPLAQAGSLLCAPLNI